MKQNLLFLLLLFISLSTFDQALTVDPINPMESKDASVSTFKVSATLTNTTDSVLNLTWVRTRNDLPQTWTSAVCDVNLCWATSVTSKDFVLQPGQSGDFSITYYNQSGVTGTGIVDLHVYAPSDSANINATNTFTANVFPVSTNRTFVEKIKVFPNPATNYFQLTDNRNIERLVIYNIVGRQMKAFKVSSKTEKYNVSNLPRGMYLVRLMDKGNNVVQTIRISKR